MSEGLLTRRISQCQCKQSLNYPLMLPSKSTTFALLTAVIMAMFHLMTMNMMIIDDDDDED